MNLYNPYNRWSSGCIVYKKTKNDILFLAAYQKKLDGNHHWVSPKGQIEDNETSREAALRETCEEVGIKTVKYICFIGSNKFFSEQSSMRIDWHLVQSCKPEEVVLQKEEGFLDFKWVNINEAQNTFTYSNFTKFITKSYKTIIYHQNNSLPEEQYIKKY